MVDSGPAGFGDGSGLAALGIVPQTIEKRDSGSISRLAEHDANRYTGL